jgi:diguanylate cyclase (GGDEF)-like protein
MIRGMREAEDRERPSPGAPVLGDVGQRALRRSRIERELVIARLRGFALAFNVIQAVIRPGDSVPLTWGLAAILAVDFLGTYAVLRRDVQRFHETVGVVGMTVDALVCGLVLANNLHDPADPVFLIVVFLALEAALRWGRVGGLVGGLASGLLAAAWGWGVIERTGEGRFEHLTMRFFTVAIVGTITGALVHRLDQERARLAELAYTDALTGLANRSALHEELAAAVEGGEPLALVFVDLDGFKAVNDELGHTAGDAVLATVAGRMRHAVRSQDAIARLGGDEFVAVVRGDATVAVHDLADRLRRAVEAPIEIGGRVVRVGASCGAVIAGPEDDVDSLLRRADHAMYESKRSARSSSQAYVDPSDVASSCQSSPAARSPFQN